MLCNRCRFQHSQTVQHSGPWLQATPAMYFASIFNVSRHPCQPLFSPFPFPILARPSRVHEKHIQYPSRFAEHLRPTHGCLHRGRVDPRKLRRFSYCPSQFAKHKSIPAHGLCTNVDYLQEQHAKQTSEPHAPSSEERVHSASPRTLGGACAKKRRQPRNSGEQAPAALNINLPKTKLNQLHMACGREVPGLVCKACKNRRKLSYTIFPCSGRLEMCYASKDLGGTVLPSTPP